MTTRSHRLVTAAVAGGLAALTALGLACGEVPTLENGIAYLEPLALPAPAVAVGDTLRDSTGAVAPLGVRAFGRDGALLPNVTATFLPTALPAPVTINAQGFVTAGDTVGSVQIVARVGTSLQTTPITLLVVPPPTSAVAASAARDSVRVLPASDTMVVSVTGPYRSGVTGVAGVVVRYRVVTFACTGDAALVALGTSAATSCGAGLATQTAVDTTDASGLASRVLVVSGTGVDSVVVSATSSTFRGAALPALRFVFRYYQP
jgi:hypothetical protein